MVNVNISGSETDKNIIPSDSNSKLWTWILGYGLIAKYQKTPDGILSRLEWFQSRLDRKQSSLDSIHSIAEKYILLDIGGRETCYIMYPYENKNLHFQLIY